MRARVNRGSLPAVVVLALGLASLSGCRPRHAADAPLAAPAQTWTWVDFPGTRCMDGSSTGLGVNLNPASSKVLVYLQGGNACFDEPSCAIVANVNGFGRADFNPWARNHGSRGVLSRADQGNPFRDWNLVFIPYCSGDVFAGSTDPGGGYGGRTQQGYANLGALLRRLVPTFEDATQVVLSGYSAGGFGAAVNYDRTQQAFGEVPVHLIDDSGPLLGDDWLKPCLQSYWRPLWNLEDAIPSDCTTCTASDGGGLGTLLPFLAAKYPEHRLGLISSTQDEVIRGFFGRGYSADCASVATMPAADFTAGLGELRQGLQAHPNARTFYLDGPEHTFTRASPLSTVATGDGSTLSQWLTSFSQETGWHDAGP